MYDHVSPFALTVETRAPLRAEWYHPLTGQRLPTGAIKAGTQDMRPPAAWGNGLVVLHVRP